MKICMIATRHTLDDARIVHKEATSLINAGHDVFLVLSCNDHYEYVRNDGSVIVVGKTPDGECNHLNLRVFGRPKRKGLLGKWKTYLELSQIAAGLKADVYHAHEPDLALAIAIRSKHLLAKQAFRADVVHDMHEYPPGQSADAVPNLLKIPTLLAHLLWGKFSMKRVTHVFTANSIVRGYALVLNYKMSVDVLYNTPSLKLFPQPASKFWPKENEKILLCHEGSLPFNRGLKEMVEAISYFRDKVCLYIVGDVFGEERLWLEQAIEEKKLQESIRITGWLPYEKVSDEIAACHAGLILFRDCINNRLAGPPNKLFNYMNAGLPVLSVDFPEMRQIIGEEDCGILICDQSVQSIVNAIKLLLEDPGNLKKMGKNGQLAVRNRYSWEVMQKKMLLSYGNISEKAKLNNS